MLGSSALLEYVRLLRSTVNCNGDAAVVGVKLYRIESSSSAVVVDTSNGREELKLMFS